MFPWLCSLQQSRVASLKAEPCKVSMFDTLFFITFFPYQNRKAQANRLKWSSENILSALLLSALLNLLWTVTHKHPWTTFTRWGKANGVENSLKHLETQHTGLCIEIEHDILLLRIFVRRLLSVPTWLTRWSRQTVIDAPFTIIRTVALMY